MSYTTLPETAGRVAALEAELLTMEESRQGRVLPPDFDRELRDLECLVRSQRAAAGGDDRSGKTQKEKRESMDLVMQVGRLRNRCDLLFSSVSSSSATLLSPIREREEASEGRGDASSRALARFVQPGRPGGEVADEVQLRSAEGRLAGEPSKFQVLACPVTKTGLILREWTDDDDAGCLERERLALIEISQAADNLQVIQELVESEVSKPQDALNQIEQTVANASEQVQEGVAALQSASDMSNRRRSWTAPALCVAGVGMGAAVVGPTAGVACVATLGKSAFLLAVGAGATYLGQQKLRDYSIDTAGQQLPRTFQPLPPESVALLMAAGREAERRLRMKLAQGPAWTQHRFSVTGIMSGLVPRSRHSDVRGDGLSYATSFEVNVPASEAFQVLQRLTLGSLDPDCKVVWSRPIDDNGIFLCYLSCSAKGLDRDFLCVARCSRALMDLPVALADQTDDGTERYVFALSSLDQHLFRAFELPEPSSDISPGKIHTCGVVVTSTGTRGSLVEVMADMDAPAPGSLLQSASLDRDIRLHVLHSADKLRKEMSHTE